METVIVLGAAGGVGRGIVPALLAANHTVVAVGRNEDRLASLADGCGDDRRLKLLRGSVASDDEAAKLVAEAAAIAPAPKAVIASLSGAGASARLLDQPGSFLRRTLDEDVVAHFIAARHLLPMLARTERETLYLVLSGPAAECAWSGYGHRSVAAAALRMMTLVMREEIKDQAVRVQQLQICTPVRTGRGNGCECPEWLGPDEVGRRVVELVEGTDRGDPIIRFGGYDGGVETRRGETTSGSDQPPAPSTLEVIRQWAGPEGNHSK